MFKPWIFQAPYLTSCSRHRCHDGFVWFISIPLKDVSIVDSFWGFGFGLSSLGVFLLSDGMKSTAQIILLTVVIVWSLRLGGYLFWRWSQEEEEDGRYQAMRKNRPLFWLQSIYIVFIFQGLLMWVIALPVTHTLAFNHTTTEPVTPLALFGLVVALAGLMIETISDWQLSGSAPIQIIRAKFLKPACGAVPGTQTISAMQPSGGGSGSSAARFRLWRSILCLPRP